jgi:hypothetical protein
MDIIDLILVVDAETLLADYPAGTSQQPVSVDRPSIFLMVRQANTVFGQASKELKVRARTGDILRWRAASLSLNCDLTVALYDFFTLRGANLFSAADDMVATVAEPLPDPADPLHPRTQTVKNVFWQATLLEPGNATYAFRFMLLDRDCKPQGYYSWDPFLTVTD